MLIDDHIFRYHDRWKFVLQRLSFIVSLKVYLESSVSGKIDQALVRRDTVSSLLGGKRMLMVLDS